MQAIVEFFGNRCLFATPLHPARWLPPWALLMVASAGQAACLAPAQGEMQALDALTFRAPAEALVKLKALADTTATATTTTTSKSTQSPAQRALWFVLASDATRQLGMTSASIEHADAGLAVLAPDTRSDLALRLRVARASQLDSSAGAIEELTAVLAELGDRPLARGCVLTARGWRQLDTDAIEAALRDLTEAVKLMTAWGERDDQMVAIGRLSVVYSRSGDHAAALRLVDESVDYFRATRAQVRLTTALSRRSDALMALKRLPQAEAALNEALNIGRQLGDVATEAAVLLRLCGVVGKQDRPGAEQEALGLCNEAERVLRASKMLDEESIHGLAMLRVEALRSRPPTQAELTALNAALEAASAGGSSSFLGRAHRTRAQALAALGDHRAAHADLLKFIELYREATSIERVNAQAAMRVGFETDRAMSRSAALDQQNRNARERLLWVAVAGLASLLAAGGLGYALLLNRRHQARLTLVAERDDLTGLPNRRKILESAEQQFALARRRGSELVLGMMDIDHFKRINDQHGHAGGDLVLSRFGQAADAALRSTDSMGRWGGEEFLVVLPDCAEFSARDVAERLRSHLSAHRNTSGEDAPIQFTVSVGLAAITPTDTNLQALIQRADSALYEAKAQGRDRVVIDRVQGSSSAKLEAGSASVIADTDAVASTEQTEQTEQTEPTEPTNQRRRGERRQRHAA